MSALSRATLVGFLLIILAITSGCANSESPLCNVSGDCDNGEVCLEGVCEPTKQNRCDESSECPTSYSCIDSKCVRDSEEEDPNPDGNGDDPGTDPGEQPDDPQPPDPNEDDEEIDPNSPRVSGVTPADGTKEVDANVQVRIKFDHPIAPPSPDGIFLRTPEGEKVDALLDYLEEEWEVLVKPEQPLRGGTSYSVNVNSVTTPDGTLGLAKQVKTQFTTAYSINSKLKDLAQAHAPIIYQELREIGGSLDYNTDIPTFVDFDGDMKANNNKTNARRSGTKLKANVYYSTLSTETHYFIHYILYYPTRRQTGGTTQGTAYFEHDFTGYVTVINRATEEVEFVEGVYVRPDFKQTGYLSYLPSNSPAKLRNEAHQSLGFGPEFLADGTRFPLYVPSGDHAACYWHKRLPSRLFSSVCEDGQGEHFVGGNGLVLIPGDQAQTIDDATQGDSGHPELTYSLTPFIEPFWTQRNDFNCGLFSAPGFQYAPYAPAGHTAITGPDGAQLYLPARLCSDDTQSLGLTPFRWFGQDSSGGEWFLDPAMALSARVNFGEDFSMNYCDNFYFGIDASASATCQVGQ